jgi:hypothetical protein
MDRAEKLKHYMAQFKDEGNVDIVVNPDGSTIRIPAKNMEESLNLLLVAVEYYEMNHDTSNEESTERHKANVWKAYNNIKEEVTK